MDYFYYGHFLEPEQPQDAPITELPEIQDAIQRALAVKGITEKYRVTMADPVPTTNEEVQRVNIRVVYENGFVLPPTDIMIWVDGFELAFRFAKAGKPL